MYVLFLFLHSIFRWAVLVSLILAIYRGYNGWAGNKEFTQTDNKIRHITATIAHIQLIFGYFLYFNSPLIKYFSANFRTVISSYSEITFFGLIHMLLMLIAIVVITIGSAFAKRKPTDIEKFKTMTIWFAIGLVIILIAIPWPFSPLAQRPYYRLF